MICEVMPATSDSSWTGSIRISGHIEEKAMTLAGDARILCAQTAVRQGSVTMATTTVSLDLDATTLDRLAERERATGESRSSRSQLAQRYIEEGLRMERYPGIFFQDGATGRRAKLIGGPDVWEVMSTVLQAEGDPDQVIETSAAWLGLPPESIHAAMAYYAEFRDEIDDRIERNRALGRESTFPDSGMRGQVPRHVSRAAHVAWQ
jgi:hypothetical protein